MNDIRIAEHRTLVSLEQIRQEKPAMVFYSAKTCWWTTRPDDLQGERGGVPLDPAGAPLFQADDVEDWLAAAEKAAREGHYGPHGIEALILAYHGNVVSSEGLPRCAMKWDSYNDLLDEALR